MDQDNIHPKGNRASPSPKKNGNGDIKGNSVPFSPKVPEASGGDSSGKVKYKKEAAHAGTNGAFFVDASGHYYDRETREPLYKGQDGNLYHQKEALDQGVVTKQQIEQDRVQAYYDARGTAVNAPVVSPTASGSASLDFMVDSAAAKAHLVQLRSDAGFGANLSGFTPDASYQSMMKIADRERQVFPSPDAAFAQSRIFSENISNGLNPEDAYVKARETLNEMAAQGHTAESVVAYYSHMGKEDIEFLKQNGAKLDDKENTFAYGQRNGMLVDGSHSVNPDAAEIAARVSGQDMIALDSSQATGENSTVRVVNHNLYQPTGRIATIANNSRGVLSGVSMIGQSMFYSGTGESGSGVRKAQDYATVVHLTVGMSVLNNARRVINAPLAMELNGMLDKLGASSIYNYRISLNSQLSNLGMRRVGMGISGAALTRQAQMQIIMIQAQIMKNGSTPALQSALSIAKQYRKIGFLTTFAKTPRRMKLGRRMLRVSTIGLRRMMSSDPEAFKGIDMTTRYSRAAMTAAKSFLWAGQKSAVLSIRATGAMANLSGKLAAKAGNALSKSSNPVAAKAGRGLQKYSRGIKKVGNVKRKLGVKTGHIRDKVGGFIRDPFGIKFKTRRQINAIIKKSFGKLAAKYTFLGKIKNAFGIISKVSAFVSTVVGAVVQFVLFLFGIFLLLGLFILLITTLITTILGAFDFSGYDETVQDVVVGKLEECYEEDIQKMLDLTQDYDQSTIDYDDSFRDYDKYNEMKSEADASSFIQSTNCAEIIAMTLTRFDYDIDTIAEEDDISRSEKREIEKYIEELYYGSHEIYVDVTTTSYEYDTGEVDADGNPIMGTTTRTSAALTYRSYYYEYMFDESIVSLGRSETPVIYNGGSGGGGVYGFVTSWDDMYANMRNNGFTHEGAAGMMANLAVETAGGQATWDESDIRNNFIDTTLISSDGHNSYGIVQWTGGRKTNLINWCIENNYDHTTIAGQLAFMYHEMQNSYSGTYNYLRTEGHSANDCGLYVAAHYEVCAVEYRAKRGILAETFAAMYDRYKEDWSELVSTGETIVAYAIQYEGRIHYTQGTGGYTGTRYLGPDLDQAVYKGNGTPTIGTDCSGFIYSAYKHFGITLPTYTGAYPSSNKVSLDELQPGDILWRSGHVALYIGNGQIIQASDCYGGDHSRDLNVSSVSGQSWACAYRYWE